MVGLTAVLMPCVTLAQPPPLKTDLTLSMVGDGYYNSIKAGQEKTIYINVGNEGTKTLTNIRLTSDATQELTVQFTPSVIESLDPGDSQSVDVLLKPAENLSKGDYSVALMAQADETRQVIGTTVHVESSSLFWVWIGIGIGALLIAGFVIIFLRFGRE